MKNGLKFLIKNSTDFEACLIVIGMIYKPYASLEAQERYNQFTEEQKQFIKEWLA